jgi:hypothetical protein
METILKKLYYADLDRDQFFYDKNPEYRSINEKAIKVMESLEKKFYPSIRVRGNVSRDIL